MRFGFEPFPSPNDKLSSEVSCVYFYEISIGDPMPLVLEIVLEIQWFLCSVVSSAIVSDDRRYLLNLAGLSGDEEVNYFTVLG
jgi:hypothetical protein